MPIYISFSPKPLEAGRTFEDSVYPVLKSIADRLPGSVLHHGFLPREEFIKRGFPTELVDTLDELFPMQVKYNINGELDIENMVQAVKNYKIFVIGDVSDGVHKDIELLQTLNADIDYLSYPTLVATFKHHGGERYTLPIWRFNDEKGGIEPSDKIKEIEFLRGHKDKSERQQGVLTEALLALLIDRQRRLNSEVPDPRSEQVVDHLQEALRLLAEREAERKAAGVLNTRKEIPKV